MAFFTGIVTVVRYLLSLVLVYGVYTEAGVWTAASVFLIFAGMEVHLLTDRKRYGP